MPCNPFTRQNLVGMYAWSAAVPMRRIRYSAPRRLTLALYAPDTQAVTIRQRVKRIGGSLGVLLPRDIAKAMDIGEGTEVRLTLVGRQLVVEPADDSLNAGAFRRALAAVLRRHRRTFERLAAYDRGDWSPRKR